MLAFVLEIELMQQNGDEPPTLNDLVVDAFKHKFDKAFLGYGLLQTWTPESSIIEIN
jgi:hypothetical protein